MMKYFNSIAIDTHMPLALLSSVATVISYEKRISLNNQSVPFYYPAARKFEYVAILGGSIRDMSVILIRARRLKIENTKLK